MTSLEWVVLILAVLGTVVGIVLSWVIYREVKRRDDDERI